MANFRQRVSAAVQAFKSGLAPAGPKLRANPHPPRSGNVQIREYAGARYDRLTEDWSAPLTTGDAEMKTRIRILRQRARELERNEPYSLRFLSRLEDNVYDHHGMTFRSLAGDWRNEKGKGLKYYLDKQDAQVIDLAYTEWRKNAFVTGDMSLCEGGRLALRSVARDGDEITKKVLNFKNNKFGFALQLLEADMIDDFKNEVSRDTGSLDVRRQIRMGVEVNGYMAPTAYWLLSEHPGDMQWWVAQGYWSTRHDAKDFIHPFKRSRITQVRDVTWLHGIMRDLKMLDGYDEAAIVAARTGAAKMGFITRDYNEPGDPFTGEQGGDPALVGNKAFDAEPGLIEDLSQSPGLHFEKWDPAYPHEQYDAFHKARVRRIAAGVNMSYHALANDLTEVNFSSIRAGLLEDREYYKALQTWWIYDWESPVFMAWLEWSLMAGNIKNPATGFALPFSKLEKFQMHKFRPRRWPWVDPVKDVQASIDAINNRLKSRSEVIEENSQNTFEEVISEQEAEQEYAEEHGVDLPPAADIPPSQNQEEIDETGQTDTTTGKKKQPTNKKADK